MLRIFGQLLFVTLLAACIALVVSMAYAPGQRQSVVSFVSGNRDDINAWSTIIIAIFTAILSICTIWLATSTQGMLEVTAKSIDLAKREFISTHRPKIRIKHVKLTSDIWAGESIVIDLTIVNNGSVEAFLNAVGLKYFIVKADRDLPLEPKIDSIPKLAGARLVSGLNHELTKLAVDHVVTHEENDEIQSGRSKLYCVGYVSYFDAAGQMRITGFCRVLTFPENSIAYIGNSRFRIFEDADYEYQD